jgi:hypothetical protein
MADEFNFNGNTGQINVAKDNSTMNVEQNNVKTDSYVDKSIKIGNNTGNISNISSGDHNVQKTVINQNVDKNDITELKELISKAFEQSKNEPTLTDEQKSKIQRTLKTAESNIDAENIDNLESNVDSLETINGKILSATKTVGLLTAIITKIKEVWPF